MFNEIQRSQIQLTELLNIILISYKLQTKNHLNFNSRFNLISIHILVKKKIKNLEYRGN